jgi:hypothetical protein
MHPSASVPRHRLRLIAIATALAVIVLVPASASATIYTFNVKLNTKTQNATGVPGDPGGKGTSRITMDSVTNQVCATTSWSGIDSPVVAGHIHQGAYGDPENPAVTIDLFPPDFVNGVSSPASGCTTAPPAEIPLIVACPPAYNTPLHSFNHPVGAIRGQLPGRCIMQPL